MNRPDQIVNPRSKNEPARARRVKPPGKRNQPGSYMDTVGSNDNVEPAELYSLDRDGLDASREIWDVRGLD